MSPYALLIAGAVAVGAFGGTFVYGRHVGVQACKADQADRDTLVRDVREAAQTAAAEAIGKLKVNNVTQRQVIQREIVEKPVYRDCVHSDAGVRSINDALVPPGAGDRVVPRVDAPSR